MSSDDHRQVPTPLMNACSAGDLPTLRSLLSSSQDPREYQEATILHLLAEATKKQYTDIVEYLLEQTENVDFPEDLLLSAVSSGLDIYKLYLSKNPNILRYEWQGLGDVVCRALVENKVDFLTYLLETAGADPGRSLRSTRYFYIFLPLEFAAYSSSEANARLLLKHGAIINGTNALQLAAQRGKLGMVRLLVEAGGNVNGMLDPNDPSTLYFGSRSEPRGTALHYAAEGGFKDIVEYLLDHGADPKKLNTFGYTALERAQLKRHYEIVGLIRSYGT
jgi:ankyrin repeat protein